MVLLGFLNLKMQGFLLLGWITSLLTEIRFTRKVDHLARTPSDSKGICKDFLGGSSYADKVMNGKIAEHQHSDLVMSYVSKKEDTTRQSKAYVGEVIFHGSSYNIHT